jgi:hypothetical protein
MSVDDIKSKLYAWLETFVEVPNDRLNGWSPCPYARQARLENKIKIVEAEASNIFYNIFCHLDSLNEVYDVIVYCFDASIDPKYLSMCTEELNRYRHHSGYVFLEDHPSVEEYVNGVKMNFGECALILAQKLDKLNNASEKLKQKGYYDVWSEENLNDVVNWRIQ